jgi:hypothetical protein
VVAAVDVNLVTTITTFTMVVMDKDLIMHWQLTISLTEIIMLFATKEKFIMKKIIASLLTMQLAVVTAKELAMMVGEMDVIQVDAVRVVPLQTVDVEDVASEALVHV